MIDTVRVAELNNELGVVQVREALRFARAAVRRLEAITDPDVIEAGR